MLVEYIFTYVGPTYVCAAHYKYLFFDGVAGLHIGILVLSQWLQASNCFENSDSDFPQDSEDRCWGMSHNNPNDIPESSWTS